MKRTKDEIMTNLKDIIGESTEDNVLSFIEDLNDTIDELSNTDNEDWKTKYEENDAEWRQKYRDRFFNGEVREGDAPEEAEPESKEEETEITEFEQLFMEEK